MDSRWRITAVAIPEWDTCNDWGVKKSPKGKCMSICAVIMAGGTGSRLWPVSRALPETAAIAL